MRILGAIAAILASLPVGAEDAAEETSLLEKRLVLDAFSTFLDLVPVGGFEACTYYPSRM